MAGAWAARPGTWSNSSSSTSTKTRASQDSTSPVGFTQEGIASFYSDSANGKPTANGEKYYSNQLTAAHKTLPFGTIVRVTNLKNGKKVIVRINDRGPFIRGRIIDVSGIAARRLGMVESGLVKVRIEVIR